MSHMTLLIGMGSSGSEKSSLGEQLRESYFRICVNHLHQLSFSSRRGLLEQNEDTAIESLGNCSGDPEVAQEASFLRLLLSSDAIDELSSRLIVHPSRADKEHLVNRLQKELAESQAIMTACTADQDISETSRDIQKLEMLLQAAREGRDTLSPRILGFVCASSGLTTKPDPRFRGKYHVREDWALVQLLPEVQREVQNAF
jgi:septum formation inhibitor MinC